jgi:hypothetical protein
MVYEKIFKKVTLHDVLGTEMNERGRRKKGASC